MFWLFVQVFIYLLQDYGLCEINIGESNWIGFGNYVEVFINLMFWMVVFFNIVGFVVVVVFIIVVVGMFVVLLFVCFGIIWWVIVFSCIMVVWVMFVVIGIYVWIFIFDVDCGIFNIVFCDFGFMDDLVNWFMNQWLFYVIVLLNVVYYGFLFVVIMVFVGLFGVLKEMFEVVVFDGVGVWC